MVIEVVVFRLQSPALTQDFLVAIEETTAMLKNQPGFLSRSIGQSEGEEWVDILYWESVEDAKSSVTSFQNESAGKHFSECIDPTHFQVFFTKPVE
jgi:heme-degrading monooxygenase HmoA